MGDGLFHAGHGLWPVGRYAFILGLFCYFLGSFLAVRVSPGALWIAYSAAMLYGIGFGWSFICLNTITGHFYGPAAFPRLNGMQLLVGAIFCSPAGYWGGKIFDTYRSYSLAFEICCLVAGIGIIAPFFARMPVPPEAAENEQINGQRERKSLGPPSYLNSPRHA